MPAPNVPNSATVDFYTPAIIVDTVQIERSSSFVGNYTPIEPGTPFSPKEHTVKQAADYVGSIFLGQKAGEDREFQQRVWGTIPATQDVYNYDIEYSAEGQAYPIFRRRYFEMRDSYAPRTKLGALTGLYALKVTTVGAGYVQATTTVAISDTGGGTGATAIAIVDPNTGKIAKITLKSEGSGYGTGTITVTITDIGGGSGATATALVQAPGCVLVEEKTSKAPEYFDSLYLQVSRTYETLPGPWIYSYKLAEDSAIVTMKRRRNIATNITPEEDASGGVLTKTTQEGIDANIAWEIVEQRPLPGNILTDYDTEPATLALIVTTFQIVANPVSVPSPSAGQKISVKHIDNYNSWLITETRSTPSGWTEQDNGAYHFPTLFDYLGYSYTDACGAVSDNRDGFSCNVQITVVVTYGAFTAFTGLQLIPKTLQLGKLVQFSDILVDAGSFTYSGSCVGTVTFGSSSPSYSGYLSLIGTQQLVGGSSKKTSYGDFRTEKIYVTMI